MSESHCCRTLIQHFNDAIDAANSLAHIVESLKAIALFLGLVNDSDDSSNLNRPLLNEDTKNKPTGQVEESYRVRRELFENTHYVLFAKSLFSQVCVDWLPLFQHTQIEHYFDTFFSAKFDASWVLIALTEALSWAKEPFLLGKLNQLLIEYTDGGGIQRAISSLCFHSTSNETLERPSTVLTRILSLPDRVANAFSNNIKIDDWHTAFRPGSSSFIKPLIVETLMQIVEEYAQLCAESFLQNIPPSSLTRSILSPVAAGGIFGRLIILGYTNHLIRAVCSRASQCIDAYTKLRAESVNGGDIEKIPVTVRSALVLGFQMAIFRDILSSLPVNSCEKALSEFLLISPQAVLSSSSSPSSSSPSSPLSPIVMNQKILKISRSKQKRVVKLLLAMYAHVFSPSQTKTLFESNLDAKDDSYYRLINTYLEDIQNRYSLCKIHLDSTDKQCSKCTWAKRIKEKKIHTSKFIAFLLTDKLLTIKVLPPLTLKLLVNVLIQIDGALTHFTIQKMTSSASSSPSRESSSFVSTPLHQFMSDIVKRVACKWANSGFIRHATQAQHLCLTQCLNYCLKYFGDQVLGLSSSTPSSASDQAMSGVNFANHPCFPHLIAGVEQRLSNSAPYVRRCGMKIAHAFSIIIDPSKPINFDLSSSDDDDYDSDNEIAKEDRKSMQPKQHQGPDDDGRYDDISDAGEEVFHSDYTMKDNVGISSLISPAKASSEASLSIESNEGDEDGDDDNDEFDLDAAVSETNLFDFSEEHFFQNDQAEESDDSLEPYDLNEDRTHLRKVALPIYLRDCLEFLHWKDEKEAISYKNAALEAVETLVRRTPDDLDEVAVALTSTLVQMATQDIMDRKKYNELRMNCLQSLVFTCPARSVPILMEQLLTINRSVQERLEILTVLIKGAVELTGAASDSTSSQRNELSQNEEIMLFQAANAKEIPEEEHRLQIGHENDKKALSAADIIAARVEKRTRRWGNTNLKKPTIIVNRFPQYSGLFFFPLVNVFATSSSSSSTIASSLVGEPLLLERLLQVLGGLVQCSGVHPDTPVMSRALMEVLWFTRLHNNVAVRRSTLFALSRILTVLPEHILLRDFGSELEEIISWLAEVTKDEPDVQCRRIAALSLNSLKASLSEKSRFRHRLI